MAEEPVTCDQVIRLVCSSLFADKLEHFAAQTQTDTESESETEMYRSHFLFREAGPIPLCLGQGMQSWGLSHETWAEERGGYGAVTLFYDALG